MHTIARYYNTSERMTVLFQKVTNQMVRNCKEHVLLPGKLWDQDKVVLLENLTAAVHLNEAYQEQYRLKREKLQVSIVLEHNCKFTRNNVILYKGASVTVTTLLEHVH